MADEKEFDTYVKLGRRGLIVRKPSSMRELVQMRGTGWVREGSRFAPSAEAVAEAEKRAEEADKRLGVSPTSAAQAAADPAAFNALPDGTGETTEGDAAPAKAGGRKSASAAAKEESAKAGASS